jgi:hypothetical protein
MIKSIVNVFPIPFGPDSSAHVFLTSRPVIYHSFNHVRIDLMVVELPTIFSIDVGL